MLVSEIINGFEIESGRALILASASPRRRDLLQQCGLPFEVTPSHMPEPDYLYGAPADHVRRLAEDKAAQVAVDHADRWIVAADTVVILDGDMLDKPATPEEARLRLQRLSSRTHVVYTGFCVCCRARRRHISHTVKTEVTFRSLTKEDIFWYAATPEPYDKAGGYGIQGLGAVFVQHISGSYTNVVGLPVCELMEVLLREKIVNHAPTYPKNAT